MAPGRVWCAVCLVSLFILVRGELDVSRSDMQNAVDSLSTMLHRIRNEGLGIEALEEAVQKVRFNVTEDLDINEIRSRLQAEQLSATVNSTVELFESISSNYASNNGTTVSPVRCSDASSTSSGACYQGPSGSSPDSLLFGLLNEVSGLLKGQEVKFGAPDGTVISNPPSAGAQDVDSRVLPWFVKGTRLNDRPLEVVILMDFLVNSDGLLDRTREAARAVVQSLSPRDKVGVVMYDSVLRLAESAQAEVQPLCDSTINEMDTFITSFTPVEAPLEPVLADGMQRANGLFLNSTEAEKHLLFFTLSVIGPTIESTLTDSVMKLNNDVNLAIFYGSEISTAVATNAVQQLAGRGRAVRLDPALNFLNLVGVYSVPPEPFRTRNTDMMVGRNNVAAQGALLTMTQAVFNCTSFVGVLYTSIPFSTLIPSYDDLFIRRRLSYMFVVGGGPGFLGLLHPLLPSDSLTSVNVSVLEPEGVIESYLDTGIIGDGAAVVKRRLLNTGSESTYHSYTIRNVSSTYYCSSRSTLVGSFSICLVLADGERTLRSLSTDFVNVRNLYNRYSAPIYHNIRYSAVNLPRCNYFCKNSVNTHISFQLTAPSAPDIQESMSLVSTVSQYIMSAENKPSYVQMGVAEEAAVSLAVGRFWLSNASRPSDFITRRHLATPNGLYLTYPPAHLVREFAPSRTEWYLTPLAQPTFLTLSPPHRDPLQEGSEVTLSLGAVVVPPGSTDASPFAVVSGELTRNSLRVFVDQALPACRDSGNYECILIDDRGNLLYQNDVNGIPNSARFLNRNNNFLTALVDLSRSSWLEKTQCQDLFNVNIDTNTFYRVNIGADEVISNPPSHCTDYLIQRVPGTNTFLIVYDKNSRTTGCTKSRLCVCSSGSAACFNCEAFAPDFCECPCSCSGNCNPLEDNIPLCPRNVLDNPNFSAAENEATPTKQVSLCFNQECQCRTNFSSCFGVRDCHWCETEQRCVQNTECCNPASGSQCCMAEARIGSFCEQYREQCSIDPAGKVPSSCDVGTGQLPRTSQTTAIIAGVVGGILGLLVVILIVILLVYYQFFRKADPQEESSRESAFDFSNKTALSGGSSGGSSEGKTKAKKEKEKEAEVEKEPTPEKQQDEATV